MCIRDRPYGVTGVVVDNCDDDEIITYLGLTKNTYGDWNRNTKANMVYDLIIMWSNPVNHSYGVMEPLEKVNSCYIDGSNKMYLIKNELCIHKIRLLFDDGG